MRRAFVYAAWALLLIAPALARSHHKSDDSTPAPVLKVSGLQFTLPAAWISETPSSPARIGQWQVPPPRGEAGESGEMVAFYFGQDIGGSAKENIAGWTASMTTPDGHPSTGDMKEHVVGGLHISQVVLYGTYSDPVPIAGMPPLAKTGYALVGTVIESPLGNVYWRFTGPEPLVTANLALFNKMIDSVRPEDKSPAP